MASHSNFKKAAGLMLVAILASRILGFVREMLIARQFGQTGAVSAYYAAFNVPDLLYFFLSSGALSAAFIPVFTEYFETGWKEEAWKVYSILACFMGIVLTAAVAIAWVFARPLVSVLAVPGFVTSHPELVPLTMALTRIILPCQLFFLLGGLMMATLQSRQEFRATAAAPVIYNIFIIFGALFLSHRFHTGGLAIGALIGAFLGNVAYAYYWMRKLGFEFHPSLNLRHPGVIRVAQLALPVILGLGLPQIDVIVNRWFGSFVSASAPAALNYANRLMQLPLGIFAQAAGTAILPMLAAYAAKNAFDDMRSGVAYGLRAIMVESIPATVFLIVMADPLVRAAYMGKQFHPSDVPVTVVPLIWYSVGIFAWAGQRIIAPGFFALQDTITPVVIGTVSTIIFIPLNFILMKSMGTGGIALATTIGISLHFFAMTWFLRRRLHGLEGTKTLKTVCRILIAAAAMVVICFGVRIEMSRAIGSWQIQDGDMRHPMRMIATLQAGKTPLSTYLNTKLSSETVKTQDMIHDLNDVITTDTIYTPKRFTGISLSGKLVAWARSKPEGKDLAEVNRRLLEAAYPGEIVRVPKGQAKRMSRVVGSWPLHDGDVIVRHPARMMAILQSDSTPLSSYLNSEFSSNAVKTQNMTHNLNDTMANDTKDTIYTPERFAGISLPRKLLALAERNPKGKRLAKVNRRLLEAAYPREIVRRPIDRVESRMGSALTVLVALILSGMVYFILLRLLKVDELDYIWNALRRKFTKRPGGGSGCVALEMMDMGEQLE